MTAVQDLLGTDEPRSSTVGAATALLDAYQPETDHFFASPTRTLLAHGIRARVPHDARPLAARVRETLEATGDPEALVLGAIPFDQSGPVTLAVPASVRRAGALGTDPLLGLPAPAAPPAGWELRPVPEPPAYAAAVADAVRRMTAGEFDKVVLARALDVRGAGRPDVPGMLQRLARRDPGGYTFAVPSGPGRTLLGASPELLLSRRGKRLVTNPLAGSAPRSTDLAEDVRRAAALLNSAKDLREHALVVDAIRAALAPFCTGLDVPERPTLVRTAAMWHLSSTLTATLADDSLSALDLACALHPTPAVCGAPTRLAREVIRELEPFDRGLYTGIVGWGDARGDGEWVVTIRCAEAGAEGLRLFAGAGAGAGAGVVADSSPQAETEETEAKFGTFLHALGASL
ncbi:isochorismate synthase [Streptomyces physcomitrii]|uniref:isochorismate synthase n=1 Tax=Streptomyces physcomitrii TaxID=2724184 RepID=UPI0034240C8C